MCKRRYLLFCIFFKGIWEIIFVQIKEFRVSFWNELKLKLTMPCNWTFWTFAPKRSKMWTSEAQEKLKVKVYMFISKFETNSQILSDSTNLRREVAYPNHYWIEWLWRTPEEGKLKCQWWETARIPGLKEMKAKLEDIMIAKAAMTHGGP